MNKNTLFYLIIAGLVVLPSSPAFAEELAEDTVSEQPAEPAPMPEPEPEPEPEPAPEPEIKPEPEVEDEIGAWSVVDSSGKVVNAIVCAQSVCGEGGELSKPNVLCDGCTVVYQQPGQAGYRSHEGVDVTYDDKTDTHTIKTQDGVPDHNGNVSENVRVDRRGVQLSESQTNYFESDDGEVSAKTNISSIRQLSDEDAEELAPDRVDVEISSGATKTYKTPKEAAESLKEDIELELDNPEEKPVTESFRSSVMNVVSKIVEFFSSLFK